MKNAFDEVIDRIQKDNDGRETAVVQELMAKREELGDDAPEEEVNAAIRDILLSHLSDDQNAEEEQEEYGLSEEDRQFMEDATASVREYLNGNDWGFGERAPRPDVRVFDMGFAVNNVNLRIMICVETNPRVCRIAAVLPAIVDMTYEYPVCKAILKENFPKRFGSFRYDERDGEITYEHCFLITRGIRQDELKLYFDAVVGSAADGYGAIRRCCVGRFKENEIEVILRKVNDLVSDISDAE